MATPLSALPEMRLPAPATEPPMVLFEALSVKSWREMSRTPLRLFPMAAVPRCVRADVSSPAPGFRPARCRR